MTQAVSRCILTIEQRLARGSEALPNLASHTLYLSAVDMLHRFSVGDFDRARQMLLALAAYASYVVNAAQFVWKLRMARLDAAARALAPNSSFNLDSGVPAR